MAISASFLQSIDNATGFNKETFEQVHSDGSMVTSIRVNPSKWIPSSGNCFKISSHIPWCANGYYLEQRPSFTLDPLFHTGAYYVQEASSMFLEQALTQTIDISQPIKVLDLCAAPGGKSTLIQSLLTHNSLLVSNEVIKTRVNTLSENVTKWGAANVIVTNNDAKDFQRLPHYFDAIVVDAPCSGSGLFRKHPEAINEWSEQNVQLCSQRQQRILADVLPALKDGGILIYSTCSYSEEENEQIAGWLARQFKLEPLRLELDAAWGVVETQSQPHASFGYRFYPDKVKGEGFFIAVFKKNEKGDNQWQEARKKNKLERATAKETEVASSFLHNPHEYFFFKQHEEVVAMPRALEEALAAVQNVLYIKKAGIKMGAVIRDELIPTHEMALCNLLSRDIPFIETDDATALQYLRKQDVQLDTNIKGWALLKYKQLSLGWVKILPNRINNYYPKEWRILNK